MNYSTMSAASLIFHPQLRFVVLCYLPIRDQLERYRPLNSQSWTARALEHISEFIIEYLHRGFELAPSEFAEKYWPPFCQLHLADEPRFRETITTMFQEIPADWNRFRREEVALMWSNMGNLASSKKHSFTSTSTAASVGGIESAQKRSYSNMECFIKALEIAPTLGRAWRNLSLVLSDDNSEMDAKAEVNGKAYTALGCIVECVRCDPHDCSGWLTLGALVSSSTEPAVVEGLGTFNEVKCYQQGIHMADAYPEENDDPFSVSLLWSNLAKHLAYGEGYGRGSTIQMNGREMNVVDCAVESLRANEDASTLLFLAREMHGVDAELEYFFAADPGREAPNVKLVDTVKIHDQEWTALDCIARSLRHKEPASRAWADAMVLMFAERLRNRRTGYPDREVRPMRVGDHEYTIEQCLLKGWLSIDAAKAESRGYYLSDAMAFLTGEIQETVTVDGKNYTLQLDEEEGYRWVEE